MKLEFQDDLIKFLIQKKEAKKYIEILENELFDLDTNKTVFDLLKSFVKKYNSQPSLGNILEFFDREVKQKKFKGEDLSEVYKEIEESIRDAYEPFTANSDQIREIILSEYQMKLMRNLFVDNASKLKSGDVEIVKDVFRQVSEIKRIGETDLEDEDNKGVFALAQFQKGQRTLVEGSPTYLKALNKMTSTKGFYSPQLIVLMGAPKSFKTGTLLNIAMNYVRDGKKVYYVDCENGEDRILDRFYQAMLEATWLEYASGDLDDTLEEMVGRFMAMGGDFKADFYPAHTKSIADVEEELETLKSEHGWIPDIICYDYLDLMKPIDYRIKEKRLQIQAVYFDAIRLQKKNDMFGITLSQVNKEAVDKKVIDMKGFAEDFGKAANCHAAFAICGTPEEKDAGVRRIVPVVQRDGVASHSHSACFVEFEESRMAVREISKTQWKERVEIQEGKRSKPKSRLKKARPNTKYLKDE